MGWSWPESALSNRETVMEELIQGRELASQLCRVLDVRKSTLVSGGGGDVGSAERLVNKILGSFANTLLVLNGKESDEELVSGDRIQGNSSGGGSADSSSWDANHAIKSEDFHEEISCKITSTFKDRRGSYKRRDYLNASELVLDCTSPSESSNYIIFGDMKQDHPFYSSFTSVKKEVEIKEEKPQQIDDHMMASHHNHSSSCDYIVSPHPTAFESFGPLSGLSSTIDPYDHDGNVISSLIVWPYYLDDEVLRF